jgi:mRNA-degrading endonuclease RelE of RelBE toxin-antitoxin system
MASASEIIDPPPGPAALESLNPFRPRSGADIKLLQGGLTGYRSRVGDYRAFYSVIDDVVYVTKVLHRSHAYD